jgi:hypothetical protein
MEEQMRYYMIILCLILVGSIGLSQKKKPIKWNVTKNLPDLPRKPAPPIDMAAFQKSLAPINQNILASNKKSLESGLLKKGAAPGASIEDVEITQRTDIRIADEADAIAVLNPVDPHTVMLSRFTSDGSLKWKKNINFSSEGYNLAAGSSAVRISNDGRIAVVYGYQDHEKWIIGVYDEQGNVIAENKPYAHFAPSGNYFYGYESQYQEASLDIYDSRTFQPIAINAEFIPPSPGNQYRYTYRIFENDILAVEILDSQLKKINKKDLYLYGLKDRRVIYHQNLMTASGSLTSGISHAELKGSRFVSTVFDPISRQQSLLIVNIETGQSAIQPVERVISRCLSTDGNFLFMFTGPKIEKKCSVLDLNTNKTVFNNKLDLPRLAIEEFSIQDNSLRILCATSWGNNSRPALHTISLKGTEQNVVEGWFNLKRNKNLVPLSDVQNTAKTVISVSN